MNALKLLNIRPSKGAFKKRVAAAARATARILHFPRRSDMATKLQTLLPHREHSFMERMRVAGETTARILHLPRRDRHGPHASPPITFGGGGGSSEDDAEIVALGREFDDVLEATARFRAERFLPAIREFDARTTISPEVSDALTMRAPSGRVGCMWTVQALEMALKGRFAAPFDREAAEALGPEGLVHLLPLAREREGRMEAAKADLGLEAIDAELERLDDERESIGERIADLPAPRSAEGFAVCVKVLHDCAPELWIEAGYDAGEWTDNLAGKLIEVAAEALGAAPPRQSA